MKITLNNTSSVVVPLSNTVSSDNKLAANNQQTPTTTTETTNQPQLQIDKAISGLLAQLAKSLVIRHNILQQLPQDIMTYVEQILQQTMPDKENLNQGLASLLKAQKNSTEQLKSLSATLNFLSADSSPDPVLKLPGTFVTLLNKVAVMHSSEPLSVDKRNSDNTSLLKLAHQLLDSATHEQASDTVKSMWNNSVFNSNNKLNTVFQQFMKQLALPFADRETMSDSFSPSLSQSSDTSSTPVLDKNTFSESLIRNSDSDIENNDIKQQLSSSNSLTNHENKTTPLLKSLVKEQQVLAQQQASSAEGDGLAENQSSAGMSRQTVSGFISEKLATSQPSQKSPAFNTDYTTELDSTILKQVIQEFAKSILLIKQQQLTKPEIAVLQQVADDINVEFSDEDLLTMKHFFTALFEAMPAVVKQAAQKSPEIQQLWLLKQMNEMTQLTGLDAKTMQHSSKLLDQLSQSLNNSTNQQAESFEGHRSLTFTVPLYFGEQHSYPAYFHIYHQNKKEDSSDSELDRETWLRVSLVTENAGTVDLIFRLFKDNQLNLRVGLDNHNAAQLFNGFIPEIRTAIESTPITVTDISINTIGEK